MEKTTLREGAPEAEARVSDAIAAALKAGVSVERLVVLLDGAVAKERTEVRENDREGALSFITTHKKLVATAGDISTLLSPEEVDEFSKAEPLSYKIPRSSSDFHDVVYFKGVDGGLYTMEIRDNQRLGTKILRATGRFDSGWNRASGGNECCIYDLMKMVGGAEGSPSFEGVMYKISNGATRNAEEIARQTNLEISKAREI